MMTAFLAIGATESMQLTKSVTRSFMIASVLADHCSGAFAGPPLAIDDPGILDPGQWEIIGAATGSGFNSIDTYQLPVLDVSYGLTPNTQLSASMPYVFTKTVDKEGTSDFGNLALGFKWRFWTRDNVQVAFAPAYAFGTRVEAARRGIGDDSNILLLPVNFEYAVGAWSVNGELGYAIVSEGSDTLTYGAAFGHPIAERVQFLFELYGGSATDFARDDLNFNIGFDIELNPRLHWLMSAGSGVWASDIEEERLKWDFFLGIQYFTLGR